MCFLKKLFCKKKEKQEKEDENWYEKPPVESEWVPAEGGALSGENQIYYTTGKAGLNAKN